MILTVTLNASIDKLYTVKSFTQDTVMRVKECNYTAGGKGINVSRVAKIAGEDVTATGFIGGHSGEYITEELVKSGIISDFVKADGESRSCINILDESSGKHTEFLEPGLSVNQKDIDSFYHAFEKNLQSCSLVTISGSAPLGTNKDIYQKLILLADKHNKKAILDSSGELLKNGIKANPLLIKPNAEEMSALMNMPADTEEDIVKAAQKLHNGGISYVSVSLGKHGAILVCDEGIFRGYTPDIPVVNTVGCGDSMVAGFAVGFVRKYTAEEAFRFAMAVSTANALSRLTGHYLPKDAEKVMDKIKIVKL